MPNELIYQSEFKGEEMDARFAAVAQLVADLDHAVGGAGEEDLHAAGRRLVGAQLGGAGALGRQLFDGTDELGVGIVMVTDDTVGHRCRE